MHGVMGLGLRVLPGCFGVFGFGIWGLVLSW